MTSLVKIAFVVTLLLGLNWVAQSRPSLAGWIAAAPVVSLLSMSLLLVDGADNRKIADFMTAVALGQVPNVIFLVTFVVLLSRGFSIAVALGVGVGIWVIGTAVANASGLLAR